ncbi:MAG: O-methyltransferase [Desulfobacterales bacterium]|jgi:predicted O-methyltransferase YrrM|nr:O-methyltransferase [Desulfobacterales bacterium]
MSEIVPNPYDYFRQFVPERSALLKRLEKEAVSEDIPIIGPVVGALLNILARVTGAERILELGCATGYSAIYMAEALNGSKGRIVTMENDPVFAERARENIAAAGYDGIITVRLTDAVTELSVLDPYVDMIFMDIEKEDYVRVLSDCHRLLKPGGLLVADNVGFKDADSFNRGIFNHPEWRAVNLFSFLPLHSPELDGLCLATRV